MKTRARLFGCWSQWVACAVAVGLGCALFFFVDLTPRVEGDFFFSRNDPQAKKAASIEEEFGGAPQVFVTLRDNLDGEYASEGLERIDEAFETIRSGAGLKTVVVP
jgi:hypothetical protein